jgi:hypothetical protein
MYIVCLKNHGIASLPEFASVVDKSISVGIFC